MRNLAWMVGAAVVLMSALLACSKQADGSSNRAVQVSTTQVKATKNLRSLSLAELYAVRDVSREISSMTQAPVVAEISSQKTTADTDQFSSINRERLQAKMEEMQKLYAKQNVSQEIARMGGSVDYVAIRAK